MWRHVEPCRPGRACPETLLLKLRVPDHADLRDMAALGRCGHTRDHLVLDQPVWASSSGCSGIAARSTSLAASAARFGSGVFSQRAVERRWESTSAIACRPVHNSASALASGGLKCCWMSMSASTRSGHRAVPVRASGARSTRKCQVRSLCLARLIAESLATNGLAGNRIAFFVPDIRRISDMCRQAGVTEHRRVRK
jgi:hypothetical protein